MFTNYYKMFQTEIDPLSDWIYTNINDEITLYHYIGHDVDLTVPAENASMAPMDLSSPWSQPSYSVHNYPFVNNRNFNSIDMQNVSIPINTSYYFANCTNLKSINNMNLCASYQDCLSSNSNSF